MQLSNHTKLVLIKALHTLIWLLFVSIIGYVLWSGISGRVTTYSWLSVGAVLLEGLTLAFFKGNCPLTIVARRFSTDPSSNFDIYLPAWLARYNKLIFTTIFCIGLALLLLTLTN